jgi:hypothetical protein
MRSALLAATGIAWLIAGCSDTPSVQAPSQEIPAVHPDTAGMKPLAGFEDRVQRRALALDTTLADHQALRMVLKNEIPGYRLESSESNRFASPLFSFAEANKVFFDAKDDYIELTLGDYVANPDFFRVNLQRYNLAQGVEIGGVKEEKRTVEGLAPSWVKEFFCWSSFNRRKQLAWVFMGMDDRYFLTIEASGQGDFLDLGKVKQWLDWDHLYKPS